MKIYGLLTSRPIDFLLLLDWFWSHRHHCTRVRPPNAETNATRASADMVVMARLCIEAGRPVVVTVTDSADGSTRFSFRSL
jgi:hypothetical protein